MGTRSETTSYEGRERTGTHAIANTGSNDRERGVSKRVATHARNYVADEVHTRRSKSVNDVGTLAKALKLTSQQLEGNVASPYLDKLADRLEGWSESLKKVELRDMTRMAQDLAKREPLLFYAGVFAAGVAGARFLKCTAETVTNSNTAKSARKS